MRLVKVGRIMCFLVGISFPLLLLYFYLPSLTFEVLFKDLIETFYISLPELLLFVGGITSITEWQLELRKIKFA